MIVDPETAGAPEIYKLLIGAIVPRPIAFVGSLSASGVRNLAPFSFFTAVSANPPVICFCPMIGAQGQCKDTLVNIRATGNFTVNIVSEDMAERMNVASGAYSPEVDEFEMSGLTPLTGDLIRAPRVGESRVSMECKLFTIVDVSAKPQGGSLVLGEVLRFHVDDAVVERGRIDPDLLRAIGRMGGPAYVRTRDRFDMERPEV